MNKTVKFGVNVAEVEIYCNQNKSKLINCDKRNSLNA